MENSINSTNSTNSKNSPRRFLKGVNPAAFLDDWREWHAVVVGFSEVICPWPPRHGPSPQNKKDLEDEHHYYMWGRALGILAWVTIGCVIRLTLF